MRNPEPNCHSSIKYISLSFVFLLLIVSELACEGPTGPEGPAGAVGSAGAVGPAGDPDKQIRLNIPAGGHGSNGIDWRILPESSHLIKFSKNFYVNIDSIIFICSFGNDGSSDDSVFVNLYNVTDSLPIANSLLPNNTNPYGWTESGNLFDELPSKEINLAIRIRQETLETGGGIASAYLLLYRK